MAGTWAETATSRLEELDQRTQRIENKLDALLTRFRISVEPTVDAKSEIEARATARSNSTVPVPSVGFVGASGGNPVDDIKAAIRSRSRYFAEAQDKQPSARADGPFVYEVLASDRREIRLLGLLASDSESDQVVCELRNVQLDTDQGPITARSIDRFNSMSLSEKQNRRGPRYNALSYTWGTPEKNGSIILNGHYFPVTRNLETALRQLRQIKTNTVPTVRWWVDAISINQDDVLERNSQVSLMRRIYKKAQHVSIWLGDEADDSSFGLDTVMKMTSPPKREPGSLNFQAQVTSSEEKLRCWKALWALYQRPWFERVWIRQEIAVSKYQTVYCGAYSCLFNTLVTATRMLDYVYKDMAYRPLPLPKSALPTPPYTNLKLLADLSMQVSMGGNFAHLKELLAQTRSCQATDLRDKVFSVLGMSDPEVYRLQPDYRTSQSEVFISTTRCVIEASKRLDILSSCQSCDSTDLPTWVPDFAQEWKRWPFKAIEGRHNPSSKDAEYVFKGDSLQVKGDFIDSVEYICKDYVRVDDADDDLDQLLARWKQFVIDTLASLKNRRGLDSTHFLECLCDKRSGEPWLKLISAEEHLGWGLNYSPEDKLLPPELPRTPYDIKHLRSLLVDDDFKDEIKPYAKFYEYLRKNGFGRRLCLSKKFVVGLVPEEVQVGDELVIIHGASFPFVLRQKGNDHTVVGEAYLPTCATRAYHYEDNRRWYKLV